MRQTSRRSTAVPRSSTRVQGTTADLARRVDSPRRRLRMEQQAAKARSTRGRSLAVVAVTLGMFGVYATPAYAYEEVVDPVAGQIVAAGVRDASSLTQSYEVGDVVDAPLAEVAPMRAEVKRSPLLDAATRTGWERPPIADGAPIWPFAVASRISDGFGARNAPCSGCSSQHNGIDFVPGYGTPILATADGIVRQVSSGQDWSFGEYVVIDHLVDGTPVTTLSAHMAPGSPTVEPGQFVKAGDVIGQVGNTGMSTGAHLHLEVHIGGVPVDPMNWWLAGVSGPA